MIAERRGRVIDMKLNHVWAPGLEGGARFALGRTRKYGGGDPRLPMKRLESNLMHGTLIREVVKCVSG